MMMNGKFGNGQPAFAILAMLAAMFSLLTPSLRAQSFFGSVVGTVTDSTGAAVPGATVTITNVGTNEKHSMQSGASGDYRFVNLIPATYKLEAQAPNFKRFVRGGIIVAVDSTPRVDVTLQVGAATETVEVTSQAPLLQTDSGSIGSEVEGKTVQEMPLNGRNIMNLIALVPGVVPEGSTSGSTSMNGSNGSHTNNAGWSNYAIGGNIAGQGVNFLDGAPMNMLGGNLLGFVPTQDVVQEFKVATNAPSPEFGRFAGGVVEMTTKSGSNAWHGSAYEYLRNNVLNANNFFANRTPNPATGTGSMPRPEWNQNQYGVIVTGPIKRDKAFFMFSWEGFNSRLGQVQELGTPTADMQNGIFDGEQLVDPTGKCNIAYDSATNTSTIPSGCIDPTAKVIQGWFPPPTPNFSFYGNNYFSESVAGDDNDQYNARVDYNISSKQRFFARYMYLKMNDIPVDPFHSYNGWKTANGYSQYPAQQGVLGDTYTFNPTTILDVRLSYLRQFTDNMPPSLGQDESVFNGPNSTAWSTLASQMTYHTIPQLSFEGMHGIYSMWATANLSFNWLDDYALSGSVIKIVGNHTLKFGGEIRMMDNVGITTNGAQNAPSGFFDFNAFSPLSYTGDEWADFLLGYVSDAMINTASKAGSYDYYQGYYLQDTWEAARKLTLNLGLRWELPGAISERKNRNTVALPDVTDPTTGAYGTLALVNSNLWTARSNELPKHNLFAPRLGIAYRLTDALVVRAGYGINYLPPDMTGALAESSPINMSSTSWLNPGGGSGVVSYLLSNPFPNPINQPTGRSNFGAFMTNELGQSISGVVPSSKYPYQQQWNFSAAYQFKGDTMVEAGYAGASGTHLPATMGLDELSTANIANINDGLSNGTFANENAAEQWGYNNRPHPAYLNFTDANPLYGSTTFNALQLRVEKRFHSGGEIGGSYTWQKMIGNTDNLNTYLQPGTSWGLPQDYNNLKAEKSILSYNIPQRLVINYVLNLPFGKGQKYLANARGVAGHLVSGWAANGITTFQSGVPLPIVDAGGNYLSTNLGAGTLRPNYTPGCDKKQSGSVIDRVNSGQWFNTACFTYPGDFSFGNEPRVDGALASQGIDNWDFTLVKTTAVTEKTSIDFRVEFYNIFNRVQFGSPGTSTVPAGWGAVAFGAINSTANNPRQIQGALRFNF